MTYLNDIAAPISHYSSRFTAAFVLNNPIGVAKLLFTRARGVFPNARGLCLSIYLLLSLSFSAPSLAQSTEELQLPELGDSTSGLISLQQEYQLGRAWLNAFRSQVRTVNDPLLQEYLEDLIYELATNSQLKDRRLEVIIVGNPTINAFAVPGGVIGVHNGLLLYAETEAQLASVLSHELAHISQRHFARGVEQQRRNAIPNMAGLLAGLVLAATAGGDAGIAAITASQAASLQNQLSYSRQNEQEADRIGMQTMVKADMDPNAASSMFENMLQASRYSGNRPPEFLLTHPVTESRISDTRNRARQHPRQMYTENLTYQLMRTRVELYFIDNSKEAVKRFQSKVNGKGQYPEADVYGLVLALTRNGQYQQASEQLAPLRKASPRQLSYIIAEAEIDIGSGNFQPAIDLLLDELGNTPNNHALTMSLADAYLKSKQAYKAEALLQQHSKLYPKNPDLWYLLAETHGLAGNIVGVHIARAEYFILNGALDQAQKQLGYALPLVKGNQLQTSRIKERIREIEVMKQQLKNMG